MERVKAKQIDGVVDTSSDQPVAGSKTFTDPQHFAGGNRSITVQDGVFYWCQNPGILEEPGNSRLKMENGFLVNEIFNGDQWISP